MDFVELLNEARKRLSDLARERLAPLFVEDRITRLAARLDRLNHNGNSGDKLRALIDGETTPNVDAYLQPLLQARQLANSGEQEMLDAAVSKLAAALDAMQTATLLILLGQRTTQGSITDERAYPPPLQTLLAAASTACDDATDLSVAARGLAKHASRAQDDFWGELAGNAAQQNEHALSKLRAIHDHASWWNVFEHFQHGLVYEARVDSGHGARWTHDGQRFIGFLAPFDAEERLDAAERLDAREPHSSASKIAGESESESDSSFPPLPEVVDRTVIIERYALGQRRFENVDLSGADLHNLDLRGAVFKGAKLTKAKLFNTDLEGADLSDCDIQNTYLVKTNLSHAIARRANFHGCRMEGVHWQSLDLQSANFGECNLKGAVLESCQLKATKLRGADLTDARISRSRLYGVSTEGSIWNNARVEMCALSHSYLENTDFSHAHFERCKFESAHMNGANCSSADFVNCDFVEADLTNTNFCEAQLTSVRMERTVLTGTNLQRAQLAGAQLNRANLARANLNGANLSRADLTQADLSRADLRTANLSQAVLDRTDLSWADVVDTVVDDSTRFSASKTTGVDFGTNWLLRQRVMDSAHELTIQHFCRKHRIAGFMWWAMLGCGRRNYLLLFWGIGFVFLFAGLIAISPSSFDFGQASPTFIDHLRNSLAVFVTLDLAVDKGTDTYGRSVMLVEMLMSYLMLGFMASLFSSIFPRSPD